MVSVRHCLAVLLLIFCSCASASAEGRLRAGLAGQEPFVIKGPVPTGAAVDLWEKIAAGNGWAFDYTTYDTIEGGIQAVSEGKIDVLIADTPITHDSASKVEFSQPYFQSGLQILVTDNQQSIAHRLSRDMKDILKLKIFWTLVAGVFLLTCGVYVFERRHNPDFPKKRRDGVAEAFYYVLTLALTGKSAYKGFPGVLGRIVMIVWTLLGIVTVAYVTSSITSAMTIEKLMGAISGPQDLYGKTIGVVGDTVASHYLEKKGINQLAFATLDEATNALLHSQVAAVVHDSPILRVLDFKNPRIPITVVGPIFNKQNYGFAMPFGSPFRKPLNSQLLNLHETLEASRIFTVYFGKDPA
jgi:ABC-type amino acid transport substrate-binding protein